MHTSEKNSLIAPVGKVICLAETANGGTIGIAQVNVSLAPVGTELYLQPSEGRLKLEVEVANDNALHWQEGVRATNHRAAEQRGEKYKVMAQLREVARRYKTGTLTEVDINAAIEGTLYIPE